MHLLRQNSKLSRFRFGHLGDEVVGLIIGDGYINKLARVKLSSLNKDDAVNLGCLASMARCEDGGGTRRSGLKLVNQRLHLCTHEI